MLTQKYLNELTYSIIGAAIEVHEEMGPGLLESIYEKCLAHVLKIQGFHLDTQLSVPVAFRGIYLDCNLRFDLLVEELIIVEVKAVESLHPIYDAQLLTYMKLLDMPKGILINFNCTNIFKNGQKTLVSNRFSTLPKGY